MSLLVRGYQSVSNPQEVGINPPRQSEI